MRSRRNGDEHAVRNATATTCAQPRRDAVGAGAPATICGGTSPTLLRDTKSSVDEVSARVGYESVPSFSKAFKRWRGVSPGAFRRLERETAAARRASDQADRSEVTA